LKDRRFAVIADEAHSSQTGNAAKKLKQVLTAERLEEVAEGGGGGPGRIAAGGDGWPLAAG